MVRLAALLLASAFAVAQSAAAETLTVTSQYGPGKPQTVFWEVFAKEVEAALPGEYEFNIVHSGALGGEKEEAEGVRLGSITGALSTVANLTTWVPQGAVLDLPFIFTGPDHVQRVLEGEVGKNLRKAYRAEGFEAPAFIVFGERHLLADRPLTAPADVSGLTMRVLQSDLHLDFWRGLGANPTALPITEAYSALANGVVDAMDMTKSGYEALKLYEVAPVLTETSHIVATGVVYFNADFWAGLSDAHRKVFQAAAEAAAADFDARAEAEQALALQRVVAKGAEVATVDPSIWRQATATFADAYAATLGPEAVAALATIRELASGS